MFRLLDSGFAMLKETPATETQTVLQPLKKDVEITDTQVMRRMQVAREKLREQIDIVASFEDSLALYRADADELLTKTAIVDWGRKKAKKNK